MSCFQPRDEDASAMGPGRKQDGKRSNNSQELAQDKRQIKAGSKSDARSAQHALCSMIGSSFLHGWIRTMQDLEDRVTREGKDNGRGTDKGKGTDKGRQTR